MKNQRDIDAAIRYAEIAEQRKESLKLQAFLENLIEVDKDIARLAHEEVGLLRKTRDLVVGGQ